MLRVKCNTFDLKPNFWTQTTKQPQLLRSILYNTYSRSFKANLKKKAQWGCEGNSKCSFISNCFAKVSTGPEFREEIQSERDLSQWSLVPSPFDQETRTLIIGHLIEREEHRYDKHKKVDQHNNLTFFPSSETPGMSSMYGNLKETNEDE